jgi:hypothetical protein
MRQTNSLFLKTSKTTTKQNGITATLKKRLHILLVEYFPILQNYLLETSKVIDRRIYNAYLDATYWRINHYWR